MLVAMVTLIITLTTAACGSAPRTIDDSGTLAEPPCLNCDDSLPEEPEVHFSQVPRVYVTPEEVMFYADLTTDHFEREPVWVTNTTADPVEVTDIYVANSSEPNSTKNDADYFFVDKPVGRIFVASGESTSFDVGFYGSSEQRSAWLVVQTTHELHDFLLVPLDGKFFMSNGDEGDF